MKYISYFLTLIRSGLNKIRGKNIVLPSKNVISWNAYIDADKQARIDFGQYNNIRRNVNLTARKNGEIIIGNNCFFNYNITITAHKSINIGNGVTIGPNVCIFDHDHSFRKEDTEFVSKEIIIEDNVWIGAGCIILKGVKIGKDSVIAAGSVVIEDIPDRTILLQKKTSTYVSIYGGDYFE